MSAGFVWFLLGLATAAPTVQPPAELAPWVDWVQAREPSVPCARGGRTVACVWPGPLELKAGLAGAAFSQRVVLDRDGELRLPGGPGAWPETVLVDGKIVPVLDRGGPVVEVPAGSHVVSGSLTWWRRPSTLAIPADQAMVRLWLDGVEVPQVRRDDTGIQLGRSTTEAEKQDRLDVEVSRRISDGVPMTVRTSVTLRAAGVGREVNLGQALLLDTRPTAVEAEIPARITPQGDLIVQVRPGTWTVNVDAVRLHNESTFKRPPLSEGWPASEYWVVATDEAVRAVRISGPAGIDPARAPTPTEWKSLPTYMVGEAETLSLEELRRGDPEPPPNDVSVSRSLWLDLDGGGFTVRDVLSGRLLRDWRMDMAPPLELGHVRVSGVDQVVTLGDEGAAGMELRDAALSVVAESRVEGGQRAFPAVGFDTDVSRLDMTVNLPPGWRAVTALGADSVAGAELDKWTLFDLFFVLICGLASWRLLGWKAGFLALVGLTLSRHEPNAPQWAWLAVLVATWAGRIKGAPWLETSLAWLRVSCVLWLVLVFVPFSVAHVREGLQPATGHYGMGWDAGSNNWDYEGGLTSTIEKAADFSVNAMSRGNTEFDDSYRQDKVQAEPAISGKRQSYRESYGKLQSEPAGAVQTGPGVPRWSWNTLQLGWSGPVAADQTVRLVLLPPWLNGLLAVLRVGMLTLLGLALVRSVRWPGVKVSTEAASSVAAGLIAVALGLGLGQVASAAPSPELLDELAKRVNAVPSCAPACVDVSRAEFWVKDEELSVRLTAQVQADSGMPLPGPIEGWSPRTVTVDGQPAALRLGEGGFLEARLSPGVHLVEMIGALPAGDALPLQLKMVPHRAAFYGVGWTLDGRRADGTVSPTVQLSRVRGAGDGGSVTATPSESDGLTPSLILNRTVEMGLNWTVKTTLTRVGAGRATAALKIPLLPGESVLEGGVEVKDGEALVQLGRDQLEVSWNSSLERTERLGLKAIEDVPWTEQWTVLCGPVWRCEMTGLAPVMHVSEGVWAPMWRPWPGESLDVAVVRREVAPGTTSTIDNVALNLTPGQRITEGHLSMEVRTSQGDAQRLTLPLGATLQFVRIAGRDYPGRPNAEGVLEIPMQPGSQNVELSWQQESGLSTWSHAAQVDLGGPAANASVTVNLPSSRWIALATGPRWGPVPLLWAHLGLVLLGAFILSRLPFGHLKAWQWALLLAGLTQVPVPVLGLVVGWFLLLGWRANQDELSWWARDLVLLVAIAWTPVWLGALYMGIHAGLLWAPDLQVLGNGSSNEVLRFYSDRVDGLTPAIGLLTFPNWLWRVVHLIWALWLAESLLRWLPWAYRSLASGGLFAMPPGSPTKKKGKAAPSEEGA